MLRMVNDAIEWAATQYWRQRVHRQFAQHLGREGDFENPRSHQEKVQFRKIYGNHRFYALVADKYRVREYVEKRDSTNTCAPATPGASLGSLPAQQPSHEPPAPASGSAPGRRAPGPRRATNPRRKLSVRRNMAATLEAHTTHNNSNPNRAPASMSIAQLP